MLLNIGLLRWLLAGIWLPQDLLDMYIYYSLWNLFIQGNAIWIDERTGILSANDVHNLYLLLVSLPNFYLDDLCVHSHSPKEQGFGRSI